MSKKELTMQQDNNTQFILDEILSSDIENALFKSIKDPLAIVNKNNIVLWANRAMAHVFQNKQKNVIGKICFELFRNRQSSCPDCHSHVVYDTGKPHTTQEWMDFPDGIRRWGTVKTYPIRDKNKNIVATVQMIIDITETISSLEKEKKYSEHLSKTLQALTKEKQENLLKSDEDEIKVTLSTRELEVLRLITEGLSNTEIADVLSISAHTVKSHVINIFNKLGVNDRIQAAVWAIRHNYF